MVMSESEIVREYRTAKNKPKQIAVLAELNAVKPDWIKDILLRHPESGYVKPGPKPKQKAAETEAVREVNALAPEAPGRADRDRGGAALLLMELAAMLEHCEDIDCLEKLQLAATLSGGRVMIVDIH